MTGYQHRLSHQLVSNHQTICIEDTQTRNMTRSAKGTAEEPGTNVSQKTGLNRSILAQGWYGLHTKLEYKAEWYGRLFVPVPPITPANVARHVATSMPATDRAKPYSGARIAAMKPTPT